MKTPSDVIETLRVALETRNYNDFVNCFAENAVLELPFALPASVSHFDGIDKIRERFGDSSQLHAINKLFELYNVNAIIHQSLEPETAIVELSVTGKNIATGNLFEVASSIAVICFKDGRIAHYRDYPNTMGLAHAIGLLPQLAASLLK